MPPIRTLTVTGDPTEMGLAHGQAHAKQIGELTEERLRLCATSDWARAGIDQKTIRDVVKHCVPHHQRFDEALFAELQGIAQGANVPVDDLLLMNGFTDFIDTLHHQSDDDPGGCTAFLTAPSESPDGLGYLGQTWDMHATATPYVLMLDIRPTDGPAVVSFTLTGCVGMIGMNEAGVSVGINNLYAREGRPGVCWPFVVRKMLAQETVGRALRVLESAELAGAHNYLLMGPDGNGKRPGDSRGYNIEAMPGKRVVAKLSSTLIHTNHCLSPEFIDLQRPRSEPARLSSDTRLQQATRFLQNHAGQITAQTLIELTRLREDGEFSVCLSPSRGYDVESSGACVMSPATRELWAVWGLPDENDYQRFTPGVTPGSSPGSSP